MGGGYIMAMLSDFRIASRNAVFEISEARHWAIGAFEAAFADTLPWPVATELALGFRMGAERAYQVGFLNRLVDTPEQLLPEALEACEHLLSIPPASLKNTLEIAHRLRPQLPARPRRVGRRRPLVRDGRGHRGPPGVRRGTQAELHVSARRAG